MLGIDMGCGAIKLAAMRRHRRGWQLYAYVVQALPGDVSDSDRPDRAVQQEALAEALDQIPVRFRDVAVALNSADAVTRVIRLENGLSDQDLENRIAVEAGQHLPFPVSDASMDFCRLPVDADTGASGQNVLLVACRRHCVQQQVGLLAALGLRPVVVDLDALALRRMLGPTPQGTAQVLLDLGAGGFRVHAFSGLQLMYSKTHQVGLSVVSGQEPEQLSRLIQEIRRAIQLFLISTACKEPVNIVLAGGVALTPGLVPGVSAVCGRPAGLIRLPSAVTPHVGVELSSWRVLAPQLTLACALAMRTG